MSSGCLYSYHYGLLLAANYVKVSDRLSNPAFLQLLHGRFCVWLAKLCVIFKGGLSVSTHPKLHTNAPGIRWTEIGVFLQL